LEELNRRDIESFWKKESSDFCEACSLFDLEEECVLCQSCESIQSVAKRKFAKEVENYDPTLGYFVDTLKGYDKRYCSNSTAGGLATGVLSILLEESLVDVVISVVFDEVNQEFKYTSISDVDDLKQQQRSVYTPVGAQGVIDLIRNEDARYAVTGVPALIQYLEHLKQYDETVKERLVFTLGLVSGGYKTKNYELYLSEKAKAPINSVAEYVSFRDKKKGYPYNGANYFFTKRSLGQSYQVRSGEIKYNWPFGLLKEFSSDFCGDPFNCCADITVMDGWLDDFELSEGVTLSIVRNKTLLNAINNAKGNIVIEHIDPELILKSQAGGTRHKTSGLAARIRLYKIFGNKLPRRIGNIDHEYGLIDFIEQFLRLRSSFASRKTYKKYGDAKKLERAVSRYALPLRIINKIKHAFRK
jgi:coenzyme F420 hydrogenase subunit beta